MTNLAPADEFIQSLQAEDELGLVVRAHIHIEAKLIDLLSLLAEAKALEKMGLDYFQRVHLAVALGLKEEHSKGLLALGTLVMRLLISLALRLRKLEYETCMSHFAPMTKL